MRTFPTICVQRCSVSSVGFQSSVGSRGQLASDPTKDDLFFKPYRIIEKKIKDGAGNESPVKIGFIGFVPPQIMLWDIKNLEGKAQTRDIVEAAKAWVPLTHAPGSFLRLVPGQRPMLVYKQVEDYWHEPPSGQGPGTRTTTKVRVVDGKRARLDLALGL